MTKFITEVENLTSAITVIIGIDTASDIVDSAERLKRALESDETIVETR